MKADDKQYRTVNESNRQNPVVDEYGNKRWFNEHGQLHREDGHAIEGAGGSKSWWINGKLHREDGPAYEVTGDGIKVWWVNGKHYSTIPEWVKALFIYKGHTPEKLGQERFDDLVRAFAQKMESMYES